MKKLICLSILYVYYPCLLLVVAQTSDSIRQTNVHSDEFLLQPTFPKLIFKGLLQSRYLLSLSNDMDVLGQPDPEGVSSKNGFDLRRVRVQAQASLSERTEIVLLANFAEFRNAPQGQVLESAFIRYKLSPALEFVAGQFRPWFGLEETYPVDFVKSLDFSNQYYAFARNGWTGFQQGISVMGNWGDGKLKTQYGLALVNGNGRNQARDNDNGKQLTARLARLFFPKHDVVLGINAGYGKVHGSKVQAWGFDLSSAFALGNRWRLELQAEAKEGTNADAYFSMDRHLMPRTIADHRIWAIYLLPNLRRMMLHHYIRAIEFSTRYEFTDEDYRQQNSPRHSIVPMLSLSLLEDYAARVQLGLLMDYAKTSSNVTSWQRQNLLVFQLQTRF